MDNAPQNLANYADMLPPSQRQLALEFGVRPAQGRLDFVVSACNRDAVALVDSYPHWQGGGIVLVGDTLCGKTHLCHVLSAQTPVLWLSHADFADGLHSAWADKHAEYAPNLPVGKTPCVIIEDAHAIPDFEQLFHAYNAVVNGGGHVVLTARDYPKYWGIGIADVVSRLQALATVVIAPPDDATIVMMMVKLFNDRQVQVAPDVMMYAVKRLPRQYASVVAFVEQADAFAIAERRPITIPLAKQVLDRLVD